MVAIGGLGLSPALAQSPTGTATAEAKADADLAPIAVPDPLTPAKPEHLSQPAPVVPTSVVAPDAPAAAATPPNSTTADPIIAEVRRLMTEPPAGIGAGEKTDRAALLDFYAEGNSRAVWTGSSGLTRHGEAAINEMTAHAADYGLDRVAFAHLTSLQDQRLDRRIGPD